VAFVSHNRISMHLNPKIALKRFTRSLETGMHHRLHDVRGHWAQNRKNLSCDHIWDAIDPDHFHCTLCGTNRWWRRSHQRGDQTLGTVTKDYIIKE
jgi:hypothetical protein